MLSYLIDPLHFCVALVPLAIYLFLIGAINLATRPRVVSGALDTFALGLALAGFVLVGPLELFVPAATAFRLGGWIWLLLFACYLLTLILIVLIRRPRIVIYNVAAEDLRAALLDVVADMDEEVRWAGESVCLPNLGVQFYLEISRSFRNVQLVANILDQNFDGWGRLQQKLTARLRETAGARNPYGFTLLLGSVLLLATCAFWAVNDAEMIAQSLQQMIHPGE